MTSAMRPPEFSVPLRFYRSAPRPCAYLPGRNEQLIFAELEDSGAASAYDALTHAGFRRSHNIIYRPACANCAACIPVRIVAHDFEPNRSLRRIASRNTDLRVRRRSPGVSAEHYILFRRYQKARHAGGDMADMSLAQYRAMVEDTTVDTFLTEFRVSGPDQKLAAVVLGDRLGDGLSAVYSFFDPAMRRRSLGTQVILWLIGEAVRLNLPYVYLGYWIDESPKMAYKTRFRPVEALGPKGWQQI